MTRTNVCLSLALGLALVGARSASATDYWDLGSSTDSGSSTDNDLIHGTSQQHDLQANAGPFPDQDWYGVTSSPRSSFEAVIDSTGGDLNLTSPDFQRLAFDQTTVLQSSEPAGGHGVALRWQNASSTGFTNYLVAQSVSCGITCGAEDQYHIRFYETTVSVPRFNNASGQVTVLIIQYAATQLFRNIAGTVFFYNAVGAVVGSTTFTLGENGVFVLNTATVPGAAGVGGAIKIAHDGSYGSLAVKSVALEPATGFSFDSPGLYIPH
jgi:hypothetical protein